METACWCVPVLLLLQHAAARHDASPGPLHSFQSAPSLRPPLQPAAASDALALLKHASQLEEEEEEKEEEEVTRAQWSGLGKSVVGVTVAALIFAGVLTGWGAIGFGFGLLAWGWLNNWLAIADKKNDLQVKLLTAYAKYTSCQTAVSKIAQDSHHPSHSRAQQIRSKFMNMKFYWHQVFERIEDYPCSRLPKLKKNCKPDTDKFLLNCMQRYKTGTNFESADFWKAQADVTKELLTEAKDNQRDHYVDGFILVLDIVSVGLTLGHGIHEAMEKTHKLHEAAEGLARAKEGVEGPMGKMPPLPGAIEEATKAMEAAEKTGGGVFFNWYDLFAHAGGAEFLKSTKEVTEFIQENIELKEILFNEIPEWIEEGPELIEHATSHHHQQSFQIEPDKKNVVITAKLQELIYNKCIAPDAVCDFKTDAVLELLEELIPVTTKKLQESLGGDYAVPDEVKYHGFWPIFVEEVNTFKANAKAKKPDLAKFPEYTKFQMGKDFASQLSSMNSNYDHLLDECRDTVLDPDMFFAWARNQFVPNARTYGYWNDQRSTGLSSLEVHPSRASKQLVALPMSDLEAKEHFKAHIAQEVDRLWAERCHYSWSEGRCIAGSIADRSRYDRGDSQRGIRCQWETFSLHPGCNLVDRDGAVIKRESTEAPPELVTTLDAKYEKGLVMEVCDGLTSSDFSASMKNPQCNGKTHIPQSEHTWSCYTKSELCCFKALESEYDDHLAMRKDSSERRNHIIQFKYQEKTHNTESCDVDGCYSADERKNGMICKRQCCCDINYRWDPSTKSCVECERSMRESKTCELCSLHPIKARVTFKLGGDGYSSLPQLTP